MIGTGRTRDLGHWPSSPGRGQSGVPGPGHASGVITTGKKIENFIENDDKWYSDLELKVLDLEQELAEWRQSRTRESGDGSESPPRRDREMLRARGKAERASAERAQALIKRGRRTARRPR